MGGTQEMASRAWKFLNEDRTLRYGHGGLVEAGAVLTTDGPLELCTRGIHWCRRPIDALGYAPGAMVALVRPGGDVLEPAGEDKGCSTVITVVWVADATHMLHEFACWCAETALLRERAAGREPDPRSWAAIAAKRAWLRGEIDDRQLDAAGAAAVAAAGYAAVAAARDAAWDAAWYAAWYAAGGEQNTELEARLLALAPVGGDVR